MANVVPRRTVQVDGRNYIAGTLYSVEEDVVERIIAAEAAVAAEDAAEVFLDEAPDEDAEDADEAPDASEDDAAVEDDGPPTRAAVKADWVAYAVTQGLSEEEAEAMTKEALVEQFGRHLGDEGVAPTA